ncbi:hypothetical protein [Nocardia sp. NPDC005825]|uniref:hypothetical protein n=1 Tax=unclassified Nocardia TaxID=2637762 RepID=UPI0033C29414
MFTLHIANEVEDYDAWKTAFDKFDRVRRDNGVLAYRITRAEPDNHRVYVDLDFDSRDRAVAFATVLEGIWRTPQSQRVLIGHGAPELRGLAEQQILRA